MFQFAGFPLLHYLFHVKVTFRPGFPIRTSRDRRSFTASPGFSQCPTSFFGIQRQGILRKLFVASFVMQGTGPSSGLYSLSQLLISQNLLLKFFSVFFTFDLAYILYSVFNVLSVFSDLSQSNLRLPRKALSYLFFCGPFRTRT